MVRLNATLAKAPENPVRVLQFGEGNFLRAFVDYMFDIANEKTSFNGSVAIVKPIAFGSLAAFTEQDNRYTVLLRGLVNNKPYEQTRIVTCVSDAVDCYGEYERYAAYAKLDTLRFVVSNTTEAGIVLDESDQYDLCPPKTYPGKLCKLLYERAEAFCYAQDKGLIILPVELIDDNGIELRRCVKALAKVWKLGEKFEEWLDTACIFTSTLVDRIVTGYPRDEAESLWQRFGYEDRLLVTGEPFALWVIESPRDISHELPFAKCGLPVVFTNNQKPYKQRKVRILNGAHTSFVPAAFLCGYDYVLDAMSDPMIQNFMHNTLFDEVIPMLSLPHDDLVQFAEAVTGRFQNPYIKHALLSICLNSVSKWRTRCMPSLLGYYDKERMLPKRLSFSLAALMALYHGGKYQDGVLICEREGKPYELHDDDAVLRFFASTNDANAEVLTQLFLQNKDFWGRDLTEIPGLCESVTKSLSAIWSLGIRDVMKAVQ